MRCRVWLELEADRQPGAERILIGIGERCRELGFRKSGFAVPGLPP